MCGRLACGLEPEQIKNCCGYKKPGEPHSVKPIWRTVHNAGKTYKPSYNVCPTEVAPVLLSGSHFGCDTRTIAPMIFGLIPSWSKPGETVKYSTINCRIEGIKSSKLYSGLLQRGQRCIVICNGFFEWKKTGKQGSQPYFIHPAQSESVSYNPTTWNLNDHPQHHQNNNIKVLRLAGLFEKHTQEGSNDETFSFTILTAESNSEMSWLHHRMPAILNTEEQIEVWLNSKKYDENEALQALKRKFEVAWYPVSKAVNATSNKGLLCIKENSSSEKKKSSSNFFENWLRKRSTTPPDDKENVKKSKSCHPN